MKTPEKSLLAALAVATVILGGCPKSKITEAEKQAKGTQDSVSMVFSQAICDRQAENAATGCHARGSEGPGAIRCHGEIRKKVFRDCMKRQHARN